MIFLLHVFFSSPMIHNPGLPWRCCSLCVGLRGVDLGSGELWWEEECGKKYSFGWVKKKAGLIERKAGSGGNHLNEIRGIEPSRGTRNLGSFPFICPCVTRCEIRNFLQSLSQPLPPPPSSSQPAPQTSPLAQSLTRPGESSDRVGKLRRPGWRATLFS